MLKLQINQTFVYPVMTKNYKEYKLNFKQFKFQR